MPWQTRPDTDGQVVLHFTSRMDEADDVVSALECDLPVVSECHTSTTILTGRRLVLGRRGNAVFHSRLWHGGIKSRGCG